MKYRRFRMQDLFREEISVDHPAGDQGPGIGFITILDVKMTEDLKYAKVLYSVYGSEEERDKTVEALKRARGYIKHVLGTRIKLRIMPDLTFVLDTGQDRTERIDEILKKVENQGRWKMFRKT